MTQQNISRETELQNLLADERERCNQHKQLYQTLKEDYSKVVEELTLVRQQLKDAVSKNEQIRQSQDKYIKKLEEQLREKQREIVKLSEEKKLFDPNKIRESILKEAENHYEAKMKELLEETDDMKKQYHSCYRKCSDLNTTLQKCKSEHSHEIERLKIQHLYEVEQLKNKIESLETEKLSPADNVAIELQNAKYEILQLNGSLKTLLAECEELRAKNENISFQMKSINKTHQKQLEDNMSGIRNLESEKQRALGQKEVLERELRNLQEHRRIMNNDLQASKREIMLLRGKLEECEQKYQMISTDFKIETDRLKNDYQFEREQLLDEITRTKSSLRDLAVELDHTQQLLISKEKEWRENYKLVEQKLWKESNEYQQEKEKMERKLQDLQNRKDQLVSKLTDELQICEQNLQFCCQSKLELEKELLSTKEKLEEALKNNNATAVSKLSALVSEYEQEIRALRDQINHLKMPNNVYFKETDRFFNDVLSRKKAEKSHEEEREILQLKLDWEQQKHQYHQRLEDFESQMKEMKNSSAAERKELEMKIQRYSRAVTKLKEKLEFLKSKNEELENVKESLEKNVPLEAYLELKNKLIELKRRQDAYRLVINAEPHFASRTPAPDMLLTDIKNLQLTMPSTRDALKEYELMKSTRDKTADKPSKTYYRRKKSLKSKSRDEPSRTISPVLSSSSDLELENL